MPDIVQEEKEVFYWRRWCLYILGYPQKIRHYWQTKTLYIWQLEDIPCKFRTVISKVSSIMGYLAYLYNSLFLTPQININLKYKTLQTLINNLLLKNYMTHNNDLQWYYLILNLYLNNYGDILGFHTENLSCCPVLYCTALYCTVLYCTVLY